MVMERCVEDGVVNDEHTNHNETPENSSHKKACSEFDYITPETTNETKFKVSVNHSHADFYPIFILVSDILSSNPDYSDLKSEPGEFIAFYKSAETGRIHGLRAPPYFFS